MHHRLYRVGGVETAVASGYPHEVGEHETAFPGDARVAEQSLAARDLHGVDVDPRNARADGRSDGDERSADTAAQVGDLHPGFQPQEATDAMLLPT